MALATSSDPLVKKSAADDAGRRLDGRFFQFVLAACVMNGLADRIMQSIALKGAETAFWTLFDLSTVVLLALFLGIALLAPAPRSRSLTFADRLIGCLAVALALIPVGYFSWIGVMIAGSWIFLTTDRDADASHGARILLAATVPMFWTRLGLSFAGKYVLRMDALVTSLLLGTPSTGNVVGFADGGGVFQIYPACSSLVNMSLAMLAWYTVINVFPGLSRARIVLTGIVIAVTVFLINIMRLVALGTWRDQFELIHGPIGSTVLGWITLAIVSILCWIGIRPALGQGAANRSAAGARGQTK